MVGQDIRGITFADPALEAERRQRQDQARSAFPEAGEALEGFIARRNATRARVATIPRHRAYTAADAGEHVYQGQRTLAGGVPVGLFQRGEEMRVLALSEAQARELKALRRSTRVSLEANGQVRFSPQRGLER